MSHVLVTGATGGIGLALVARLAARPEVARITAVARDPARLAALAALHPQVRILAADLADEPGADALATALAEAPPVERAAHLVGGLLLRPLPRVELADWRRCLGVNLDSAFLVLRLLLRDLQARPRPLAVVLMSSVAAGLGLASHEAVAAAKAGVEGLMRSAAAGWAERGLRINAVAPALTETPLTASLVANQAMRTAITALHPLGRLGTPADQAAAVDWLLSPEAGWVTGQVLGVDGGLGRLRGRP